MHKKAMKSHGKLVATKAGDKAVDDLNSESLDSAKTGKPFTAVGHAASRQGGSARVLVEEDVASHGEKEADGRQVVRYGGAG